MVTWSHERGVLRGHLSLDRSTKWSRTQSRKGLGYAHHAFCLIYVLVHKNSTCHFGCCDIVRSLSPWYAITQTLRKCEIKWEKRCIYLIKGKRWLDGHCQWIDEHQLTCLRSHGLEYEVIKTFSCNVIWCIDEAWWSLMIFHKTLWNEIYLQNM